MLPRDQYVQALIRKEATEGMAVAELEYLGLSLRVINVLEEKGKIIFLKDLINKSYNFLCGVGQLGPGGVKQISNALAKFDLLEKERDRWHKGSEKVEHYMNNINHSDYKQILA